jgi:acyl-CoA thioester hydrolase
MTRRMETFRGVVYPAQCDAMGHLTIKEYMGFFDQAAWHCLLQLGFHSDDILKRRIGFADARHVVDYKHELLAGELVRAESEVLRVGTKSLTARHDLFNAATGVLAASLEAVTVQYDLEKRQSIPLLDTVRQGAEACLARP